LTRVLQRYREKNLISELEKMLYNGKEGNYFRVCNFTWQD